MSYGSVAAHRPMVFDAVRNAAYFQALQAAITPDSVVLDLGAGTGLLGLMAARLGARRVYLVEPEDVIAVAGDIAAANGLDDRVVCLQGRIEDVTLPEQVDVIVSVLAGNFLLTEDLLASLVHARTAWLRPGGTLVPSAATMEAAPVSSPDLHGDEIAAWSASQYGVNLEALRPYAANSVFYRRDRLREATMLADPAVLHTMDLARDTYDVVRAEASFEVTDSGTCHGFAGWSAMKLGDEWLSTSPRAPRVHWAQAFLPLDPPMPLERGDEVSIVVSRQPHGDWTWIVRAGSHRQQHSTLLSLPLSEAALARASVRHQPILSAEGQLARAAMDLADGTHTLTAIAEELYRRHPSQCRSVDAARRLVERVVRHYA